MSKNRVNRWSWLSGSVLAAAGILLMALFVLAGIVFVFSRSEFIVWSLDLVGQERWTDHVLNHATFLNDWYYEALKWFVLFWAILLSSVLVLFMKKQHKKALWLDGLLKDFGGAVWRFLSLDFLQAKQRTAFGAFVLVVLVVRVGLSFAIPLHQDEIFSYLYSVEPGPVVALGYYDGPNNHVLYSLISSMLGLLTKEPYIVMRGLSIVAGVLSLMVLIKVLIQRYTVFYAWMGAALMAFTFCVEYYGILGRGYSLQLLFVSLMIHDVLNFTGTSTNKMGWRIALWLVLGTTVALSFTMFWLPALIVLVFINRASFSKTLLQFAMASFAVLTFYSPAILVSGINKLINNPWVQSMPREVWMVKSMSWLTSASYWLTGLEWGWIVIALIVFSLLALPSKLGVRRNSILVIGVLSGILLLFALKSVVPPTRIMTPVFPILIVAMVELFTRVDLLKKYYGLLLMGSLSLSLLIANVTYLTDYLSSHLGPYSTVEATLKPINTRANNSVYSESHVHGLYLQLFARTRGDYMAFDSKPWITIENYDLIILKSGGDYIPSGEDYFLTAEDKFVKVYQLKYVDGIAN